MAGENIPQTDAALLRAQAEAGPAGVAAYQAAKDELARTQQASLGAAVGSAQARGGPTGAMDSALSEAANLYQRRQDSMTQGQVRAQVREDTRSQRMSDYSGAVNEARGLIKDQVEQVIAPMRTQSEYDLHRLRQQGDQNVEGIDAQMRMDAAKFAAELRAAEQQAAAEQAKWEREMEQRERLAALDRAASAGGGGSTKPIALNQTTLNNLVKGLGVGQLQEASTWIGQYLPTERDLFKTVQDEAGRRYYEGLARQGYGAGGLPSTEAVDVDVTNAGLGGGTAATPPRTLPRSTVESGEPRRVDYPTSAAYIQAKKEWDQSQPGIPADAGPNTLIDYLKSEAAKRAAVSDPQLEKIGAPFAALTDPRKGLLEYIVAQHGAGTNDEYGGIFNSLLEGGYPVRTQSQLTAALGMGLPEQYGNWEKSMLDPARNQAQTGLRTDLFDKYKNAIGGGSATNALAEAMSLGVNKNVDQFTGTDADAYGISSAIQTSMQQGDIASQLMGKGDIRDRLDDTATRGETAMKDAVTAARESADETSGYSFPSIEGPNGLEFDYANATIDQIKNFGALDAAAQKGLGFSVPIDTAKTAEDQAKADEQALAVQLATDYSVKPTDLGFGENDFTPASEFIARFKSAMGSGFAGYLQQGQKIVTEAYNQNAMSPAEFAQRAMRNWVMEDPVVVKYLDANKGANQRDLDRIVTLALSYGGL